jgi:hypothetical protein
MYNFDVLTQKDFIVVNDSIKKIYNTEGKKTLGSWTPKGDGSLGYLVSHNNNVAKGVSDVYIINEKQTSGVKQFGIDDKNFYNVVVNFFVRKSITSNWLNQNDEFLEPNFITDEMKYDSIIYSLFNNSSYQKSYENSKNNFFWISAEKMKELSDIYGYDDLYNDARTASDRYVHKLLFGDERVYDKLSPDAKLVLDKATELVEKSMEFRQTISNNENNLDAWDAGYAQLKTIWKEYFQDDFKEFRQLYKNLEDRMRPLVYELGFLIE